MLDLLNGEWRSAARKATGYQVMVQNGITSPDEAAKAQNPTQVRHARALARDRR